MNIQTGDEAVSLTRPTNFTVARVKRDIFKRSAIGVMASNRSLAASDSGSNQAFGVDGTFSFFDNVTAAVHWTRTATTGRDGNDQSYQGRYDYNADRYGARGESLVVGKNFNPEVGFVRRTDFKRSVGELRFSQSLAALLSRPPGIAAPSGASAWIVQIDSAECFGLSQPLAHSPLSIRGFMRKAGLLIAAVSLVACAKNETPKPDSAAPAAAAAPAAPAALTAADLVGTVSGKIMAPPNDSVVSTFVCTTAAGSSVSKCVNSAAPKDTVDYTYTLSGADSVTWVSAAHTPPTPPKSPKLIDHVMGRLSGNKWAGTVVSVLASKPDSVVSKVKWEATKTQ